MQRSGAQAVQQSWDLCGRAIGVRAVLMTRVTCGHSRVPRRPRSQGSRVGRQGCPGGPEEKGFVRVELAAVHGIAVVVEHLPNNCRSVDTTCFCASQSPLGLAEIRAPCRAWTALMLLASRRGGFVCAFLGTPRCTHLILTTCAVFIRFGLLAHSFALTRSEFPYEHTHCRRIAFVLVVSNIRDHTGS